MPVKIKNGRFCALRFIFFPVKSTWALNKLKGYAFILGACPQTPAGLKSFPTFASKSHGPAGAPDGALSLRIILLVTLPQHRSLHTPPHMLIFASGLSGIMP